jgi:hypothetical protein
MANDMIDPADDWNPNFDDGKPTVWAAEWFGPEEKIEDEADLEKVGVHVIYIKTDQTVPNHRSLQVLDQWGFLLLLK